MLDKPTAEGAQVSFLEELSENERNNWHAAIEKVAGEKELDISVLTKICEDLHEVVVRLLSDAAPLATTKNLTPANMILFQNVLDATGVAAGYIPKKVNGVMGQRGYFAGSVRQLLEYPDFGSYRASLGLAQLPPSDPSAKAQKGK